MAEAREQAAAYGVLLYYKYTKIPDVQAAVDFFDSSCRSLALVGRVRVAPDGVNVTVGGKMESLEKHIEEMKLNPLFEGTDFKLASCDQPTNEKVIRECGFDSLSIRVVKELVTFRSNTLASSPYVFNAGRHLSATEFHSVLHDVMNGGGNGKEIVLLDARNVYETRIGKFEVPNVETLDPETRQYSDLPSWIDNHSDQLQGKSILMYCTGGIRCEMASAYIRTKGSGFENVFQLYGGIQRYLEQFPDGGFFKGKNFVYDHRISVGSSDDKVVGSCLLCGSSFDDYSSRNRCSFCRMLVLVCYECEGQGAKEYKCELCQKVEKGSNSEEAPLEVTPDSLKAPSIDQIKPFTDEVSLTNDVEQVQLASLSEARKELQENVAPTFCVPKMAKMQLVCSHQEVYEPCDDSFLLVDALLADRSNLVFQNPMFCLLIGCGSGYVITSLALIFSQYCPWTQFFATDINLRAAQTAVQTSSNHGVNCEVVATDIVSCLQNRLRKNIDVLVVNPPYVPTPENEVGAADIVSSWAGGFKGRMVIDRILDVVDELLSANGLSYMVALSENDPSEICQVMRAKGFGSRIALQRSTEEERLCDKVLERETSELSRQS